MLHEYAFDVTMDTVVRVTATSEEEARRKVLSIEAIDLNVVGDGFHITEASVDPSLETHLFEVDGISQEG